MRFFDQHCPCQEARPAVTEEDFQSGTKKGNAESVGAGKKPELHRLFALVQQQRRCSTIGSLAGNCRVLSQQSF